MLLITRRKTINITDSSSKKKNHRCSSCKRNRHQSQDGKGHRKISENSLINPHMQPQHKLSDPSAPPQSLKKPDNFGDELSFPEPPTTFNKPPGGGGGASGGNNPGNGGAGGPGDLDFDELARRFDQLKKK